MVFISLFSPSGASEITITAFGDSLIHGFGLPPDDGFVPQLNRWLAQNNADAVVINAGVSGETTAGGLARIDWTLQTNPDAFILGLGGNDMLRGLLPEQSLSNLNGILARLAAANLPVLLIGHTAPGNFGSEYQENFEAIYPYLAGQYQTLLFEEFFAPLKATGPDRYVRETYFQDDGIHPNAAGVSVIIDALGPIVLELIQQTRARK